MKPLDQVCSTDAYAPDHTAKVHNKFDTRRSIMEELRAFAHVDWLGYDGYGYDVHDGSAAVPVLATQYSHSK